MNITSEQVQILKSTWAIPNANPMDTGETVLIAFFTKFPQHKEHFKAFKNIPTEQLKVKNERNKQTKYTGIKFSIFNIYRAIPDFVGILLI